MVIVKNGRIMKHVFNNGKGPPEEIADTREV